MVSLEKVWVGNFQSRKEASKGGIFYNCDSLYLSFPTLALSLFLMAVNIKTPVVVENITLMCLRILQKLIKPPAPTSKKNKVLDRLSREPARRSCGPVFLNL